MKPGFLLILFVLSWNQVYAEGPRKIALLVAVGNYPDSTRWAKINAPNDAVLMREVLIKQGFKKSDITILQDDAATREGILKAIQKYLVDGARPGDVLFFQFSGHGQQITDDNQDELDGFDEAIVPINSPMHYGQNGYVGQKLIRDEELGNLFRKARKRIGPSGNLLVILDSCHSGTGVRGMGAARGTDIFMADSSYIVANRGKGKENGMLPTEDGKDLAPMVAFFGASADQLNFETKDEKGAPIGSLTYAFCKKITTATNATTYRGLFDQIRLEMAATAPRQQPQVEGTLDQQIFGGNLLEKPGYLRIKRALSTKSILLDAGFMQGVYEGAVIGLFSAETTDPIHGRPIVKGTITTSTPFESQVTLDSAIQKQISGGAWAYILERNFGDLGAKIAIQLDEMDGVAKALRKRLAAIPVFREDGVHPDLYVVTKAGNIFLMTGSFTLDSINRDRIQSPIAVADRLIKKIKDWAQAAYLRELQTPEDAVHLKLELIPIKLDEKKNVKEELTLQDKTDPFGNLHFRELDTFKIRVTNEGELPSYFSLVDISPDNAIVVLVPTTGKTPADFYVMPGKSIEVPGLFGISPPYGTELIKLIATDQPVDLSPIAQTRGIHARPNPSPLEKLFGQTYFTEETMTRGGKTVNIPPGSMHIESVSFIIEAPK